MTKLTSGERATLRNEGYSVNDIREITRTIKTTTYNEVLPSGETRAISEATAISILGREEWLRGVARSAFHVETTRYGKKGERIHLYSKIWLN